METSGLTCWCASGAMFDRLRQIDMVLDACLQAFCRIPPSTTLPPSFHRPFTAASLQVLGACLKPKGGTPRAAATAAPPPPDEPPGVPPPQVTAL